jgi:hypothetical protein
MENHKKCNKCKIDKSLSDFSLRKPNTYHNICKSCFNLYAKEYREKNKNIIKLKQQNWYDTRGKKWKKEYEIINKDVINKKTRDRYKNDPEFRMKKIIRSRFKKTVLGKKTYSKILNYIGVDIQYFLKWIEFNFDKNISWKNQGTYWDVEHIKPCASYNLLNEDEIKLCYNWKNLRPCEKIENYKKNDKIDDDLIKKYNDKVNLFISKYPVPS